MLLDHEAAVVRVRAGRMLQDVEIVLFLSSTLPFFSNSSIETFEFYFLKKKKTWVFYLEGGLGGAGHSCFKSGDGAAFKLEIK